MFKQQDFETMEKLRENQDYQFVTQTSDMLTIRNRKTGHIWTIKYLNIPVYYPYLIFHSWRASDKLHAHWQTYSLEKAIASVVAHDEWKIASSEQYKMYL